MLKTSTNHWTGPQVGALNSRFWDLELQTQIGRDLRTQYEKIKQEPMPERLVILLEHLEGQEQSSRLKLTH
jgi:hypothetical protein